MPPEIYFTEWILQNMNNPLSSVKKLIPVERPSLWNAVVGNRTGSSVISKGDRFGRLWHYAANKKQQM